MKRLFFVLSLCLLSGAIFAQTSKDDVFYFVQITDTHWGPELHQQRLQKAVDMINALPFQIEFVAHTGDISSDDLDNLVNLSNSLKIYKKLKAPIYYVAGNHDILPYRMKTIGIFTNTFNPLCVAIEKKGVQFYFISMVPIARKFPIKGYQPFEWVEKQLKASKGKPVIIFDHIPTANDFYNNAIHNEWDSAFLAKWTALINKYNVKALIAGHYHRNELHWLGKVPLYVAPSIAAYWDRQATFRIYKYHNGQLDYMTVYIED